jgi:hypothetical protein
MNIRAVFLRVGLAGTAWAAVAPDARAEVQAATGQTGPASEQTLILRGLDKISGQSADITAPVGKPVKYKTLRITARYCYSTPPSETPETVAFLQVNDRRPDQSSKQVFSGWMYSSTPGLNGMDHPLYDVWVIACRGSKPNEAPVAVAAVAPAKVQSPDLTDNEAPVPLPGNAEK